MQAGRVLQTPANFRDRRLFQKAKACQFCAFQDVPSQVRLVRVRAEKNAKSEMSRDE
jgi:hypothetical protein